MRLTLLGSAVLAALLMTGCDDNAKDETPAVTKKGLKMQWTLKRTVL